MSQITIHIHEKLAAKLLAEGAEGAKAAASLSRQAIRVVQACGRRIAYAPVLMPDGEGCAMSARGGLRGVIIEIDPPGTLIPGRQVVIERERPANGKSRR